LSVINLGLGQFAAGGSLTTSGLTIQLVNDNVAPGNDMFYGTGPTGTKGWFSLSGGEVSTVAGTAGQVLVNGATTPASGAVTLTLASALTGINSVTSVAGQNLVLAVGTGGTGLTIANSTLGVTIPGNITMSGATASITLGTATEVGSLAVTAAGSLALTPKIGQIATVAGVSIWRGGADVSTNIAIGDLALNAKTQDGNNVAIGYYSMRYGAAANRCVSIGAFAGEDTNTLDNTAVGFSAIQVAASQGNTAVGSYALWKAGGAYNVGVGMYALGVSSAVMGDQNTAIGSYSMSSATAGFGNVAVGMYSLHINGGNYNVALGYYAGKYETGTGAFYVNNQDRTDTAGDKAKSLLYGTFNATAASQTLTINAGTITGIGNLVLNGATSSITLGAATEILTIAATAAGAGTITTKSGQTLTLATGTAGITASGTGSHIFGTTNTVTLAAGVVTATGTGAHTFGTTNTVTMTAGALSATTSLACTSATGALTLGTATETCVLAATAAGGGSITTKSGQTLTIANGTAGITATGTGSHVFGTTNTVTLAAGAVTATATGAHTFGTTNTVTMTAGALSATASLACTAATGALTLGAATETLSVAVTAAGAGTITPKSGQTLTLATGTAGITVSGTGTHTFSGDIDVVRTSAAPTFRIYRNENVNTNGTLLGDLHFTAKNFAGTVSEIGSVAVYSENFSADATSYLTLSTRKSGIGLTEQVRVSSAGVMTVVGTVTASGTGTHTFGTTNTVTMTAGALTATGTIAASNIVTTATANGIVKADASGKIDVNWIPTDELQIVLRQGSDAERQTIVFAEGEPIWTTDLHQLWIGDGSTLGGIVPGLGTITQTLRSSNTTAATDATGTTGAIGTLGGLSVKLGAYIGTNIVSGATTGASSPIHSFIASGPSATGSRGQLAFYRSKGTNDTPTGVGTGNSLGTFDFYGYVGSGFKSTASLSVLTNEAWADGSAYGSRLELSLTANGAIVSNVAMTVLANGINSTAIGATTPSTGSFTSLASSSGRIVKVTSDTSTTFNFATTDDAVVLSNVSAITANLLSAAASGTGCRYHVYNRGAGVATITPNGAEKINGASSWPVAQNESIILVCTGVAGAEWAAF
jgi:hypothetical protein